MTQHDREYDLEDLISAWRDSRRWFGKAEELHDYYVPRFHSMAAAFGLSGPPIDGARTSMDLRDELRTAVESLEALRSPFADWLEEPGFLVPIIEQFGPAINSALGQARRAVTELILYLIQEIWNIDGDSTVTSDEVRRQGFDPDLIAPDLMDFM